MNEDNTEQQTDSVGGALKHYRLVVSSTELLACPRCNNSPSIHTVMMTGEYYKCRACNFPREQFPIPNNASVIQWNKTVLRYLG